MSRLEVVLDVVLLHHTNSLQTDDTQRLTTTLDEVVRLPVVVEAAILTADLALLARWNAFAMFLYKDKTRCGKSLLVRRKNRVLLYRVLGRSSLYTRVRRTRDVWVAIELA